MVATGSETRPCQDHDVEARQGVPVQSEMLANDPLDAVAGNGVSNISLGEGEAQAGVTKVVGAPEES